MNYLSLCFLILIISVEALHTFWILIHICYARFTQAANYLLTLFVGFFCQTETISFDTVNLSIFFFYDFGFIVSSLRRSLLSYIFF